MSEQTNEEQALANLLSCYFKAKEESGLDKDAIMLCEMVGDEIQSISLRVAADPMIRHGRLNWAR
jgi:hypothetical protein